MYLLCLLWQPWFKSSLACQKIPIDSSSENDLWSILTSGQLYHSWCKFLYNHSYKCSIKLCGSSSLRCGEYFDYVQMFMQYIKTSPIFIWRVRLGNSVLSFKLIHFFNINYVDSIYLVLNVKLLKLASRHFKQVALEYLWAFANVTMANDDGVEIAHIQTERVVSLNADNFGESYLQNKRKSLLTA